jgi:hypothetical protein
MNAIYTLSDQEPTLRSVLFNQLRPRCIQPSLWSTTRRVVENTTKKWFWNLPICFITTLNIDISIRERGPSPLSCEWLRSASLSGDGNHQSTSTLYFDIVHKTRWRQHAVSQTTCCRVLTKYSTGGTSSNFPVGVKTLEQCTIDASFFIYTSTIAAVTAVRPQPSSDDVVFMRCLHGRAFLTSRELWTNYLETRVGNVVVLLKFRY